MLKIKLLDKNCKPYRAHETDSGLDIRTKEEVILRPLETAVIPTGIAIELALGYEAQIRPRSSISKQGVITAFGTIDNGYRGEVKVTLTNSSGKKITIEQRERIAQLVIMPVITPKVEYVSELTPTERGEGGHGSTGRV